MLSTDSFEAHADWTPAVDVQELPDVFVLSAELPDVKRADLSVSIRDGLLVLSGNRRQVHDGSGKRFRHVERKFGHFERTFALPTSVDELRIHASYKNGVLYLMLPKMPTATQPVRTIVIP